MMSLKLCDLTMSVHVYIGCMSGHTSNIRSRLICVGDGLVSLALTRKSDSFRMGRYGHYMDTASDVLGLQGMNSIIFLTIIIR